MTETNKKLSRREAIKIVGAAAGASLLANIPAKWSKPELTGSNLPAYAQASGLFIDSGGFVPTRKEGRVPLDSSVYGVNNPAGTGATYYLEHFVKISAEIKDILLLLITKPENILSNPYWFPNGNDKPDGVYPTDEKGEISFQFVVSTTTPIHFIWNFQNPSDGDDLTIFTMGDGGVQFGNT